MGDIGVPAASVGLYLAAQMTGAALSSLLWGYLGDSFGNRAVIVGTAIGGFGAALAALAALALGPLPLYITFFLVGTTMSGLRLGYPNIILEMSPDHLRATCVALLGTLLAPLAFVPLIIGIAITWVPMSAILVVDAFAMAGAVGAALIVRDPRKGADGACISGPNRS